MTETNQIQQKERVYLAKGPSYICPIEGTIQFGMYDPETKSYYYLNQFEIICEFTGKLCTEDSCSDECDDFENEEEEETENTCEYCGEICEGDFCNKNHKKAYFLD